VPGHQKLSFCVFLRRNPPQTPHARTVTHCWYHTAQWHSLRVHWLRLGSRLLLGEAEMGPGHRQNGGQQQERHLDAAVGGSWWALPWGGGHLAGWCWCGGCLTSRRGLGGGSVGPARGSERRVFVSEVSSRNALASRSRSQSVRIAESHPLGAGPKRPGPCRPYHGADPAPSRSLPSRRLNAMNQAALRRSATKCVCVCVSS
jgi:hypothetical protein